MESQTGTIQTSRFPWNKGKLAGQKHPLKLKDIWAIRIRLQVANNVRELALFNWRSTANCAAATSFN